MSNKSFYIKSATEYAQTILGKTAVIEKLKYLEVKPKLQNDYGKDNDCCITSLANIIEYHKKDISMKFEDIYSNVIKYMNPNFAYNDIYGTLPMFIDSTLKNLIKHYNLINFKTHVGVVKDIGYSYDMIMKSIDKGNPIVLSVMSANNDYYKYHSMVIKGYIVYKNKTTNQEIKLLLMNDNWSKDNRFIDYNTISKISLINYYSH